MLVHLKMLLNLLGNIFLPMKGNGTLANIQLVQDCSMLLVMMSVINHVNTEHTRLSYRPTDYLHLLTSSLAWISSFTTSAQLV